MASNHDNDARETPAPERLIAALKRTQSARVFVPRTLDESVIRAARVHLVPVKTPRRSFLIPWFRWPALAAACFLICAVAYRLTRPSSSYAREDLNHDGRVDILDALQLAREVQAHKQPSPAMDLNGDGVVDGRDADVIATHAVKLEKGGRS